MIGVSVSARPNLVGYVVNDVIIGKMMAPKFIENSHHFGWGTDSIKSESCVVLKLFMNGRM